MTAVPEAGILAPSTQDGLSKRSPDERSDIRGAPRKIRVNTVNPGMIATEGVVSAGLNEGDMRKWIESVTPMGRVGKVEQA